MELAMRSKRNKKTIRGIEQMPFSKLLVADPELAKLRREYEEQPSDLRRAEADWAYCAAQASDLFDQAVGRHGLTGEAHHGCIAALAIDPNYAPAILSVGSLEYGYGRVEEAMSLFLRLPTLTGEEDLPEIIDKAGDFLIDQNDRKNAERLYSAAVDANPRVAIYHIGVGYCAGKDGRFDEAVHSMRCAVELEPDNYRHLNDLGFSLLEAGQYDEAEEILLRAIELAPRDYKLAKGNLEHLHEIQNRKPEKSTPG
jgi:tetratricopeptide (TPR) repeat protein